MQKSEIAPLIKPFLAIIVLVMAGMASAYAAFIPPNSKDQTLFENLLDQFEKADVVKKDVTDVVQTFGKPLVLSFPCNPSDSNNFVVAVITTRLAKFNDTPVHEDQVIGGTYTWDCLVTTEAGKVTLQCNNEMTLNSNLLNNGSGVNPQIHQVENEVVLYHELLHGQLMIDAIKSSGAWRHEICNRTPQEAVDYSYADPDHVLINPLQSQFAAELMEEKGGEVITKYVLPNETSNGAFETTVFKMSDYPQFRNGGEVTLRAVNINDTQFGTSNNVVFLKGNLVNKTDPGIAWLYISSQKNSSALQNGTNLGWAKRMTGLWANGRLMDPDFVYVIQNMTGQTLPGDKSGAHEVPYWLKNPAIWWYEGKIDDSAFLNLVRYLVLTRVIS